MTTTKVLTDEIKREAEQRQEDCLALTLARNALAGSGPCEVCGKGHPNYMCCEKCNHDTHRCYFCGDPLGHKEISICYILEAWG